MKHDSQLTKLKKVKTVENIPLAKHTSTLKIKKNIVKATRLDPVRYGDWEKNGRCIDF